MSRKDLELPLKKTAMTQRECQDMICVSLYVFSQECLQYLLTSEPQHTGPPCFTESEEQGSTQTAGKKVKQTYK